MKAVVLAGGVGKRLRPLTLDRPKVMVEVKGHPLLAHTLRALKSHVSEVVLVVGYMRDKIMDYFGSEFEGLKLSYVVQEEYKGTAHALLCAEKEINEPFLLIFGDTFFNPSILFELLGHVCDGVIVAKEVSNPEDYGVLEVKDGFLVRILEKVRDPPNNLINAGIYLLPPEVFEACRQVAVSERGELELTDAIELLINKGLRIKPVVIEQWVDVGNLDRLQEAEEMQF